eukprot:4957135-Amphidinium_carterae.1
MSSAKLKFGQASFLWRSEHRREKYPSCRRSFHHCCSLQMIHNYNTSVRLAFINVLGAHSRAAHGRAYAMCSQLRPELTSQLRFKAAFYKGKTAACQSSREGSEAKCAAPFHAQNTCRKAQPSRTVGWQHACPKAHRLDSSTVPHSELGAYSCDGHHYNCNSKK